MAEAIHTRGAAGDAEGHVASFLVATFAAVGSINTGKCHGGDAAHRLNWLPRVGVDTLGRITPTSSAHLIANYPHLVTNLGSLHTTQAWAFTVIENIKTIHVGSIATRAGHQELIGTHAASQCDCASTHTAGLNGSKSGGGTKENGCNADVHVDEWRR